MTTTTSPQVSQVKVHLDKHGHPHPDHRILGLYMFLIAEGMIFLGLFVAYFTFRAVAPGMQGDLPKLELMLPGINTIILISSSFVMSRGQAAIKKNDVKGLRFWFGLTASMGVLFLAGQMYEYFHLEFGLKSSIFASTFYVLTGFHGLHVLFGLILTLAVLWRSFKPDHYSDHEHFGVEAAEIYWHFVDVIWILLFVILYLL
jgi:cytochrome c oxidase subunit III